MGFLNKHFLLFASYISISFEYSRISARCNSSSHSVGGGGGDEAMMEDEGLDSDADLDIGESDGEEESDADEDLAMEMEDNRPKADEMGVEHLATLERLRQNQRQDYLKVSSD